MARDLVTTNDGSRGIMSVNLRNINYGAAKSHVDKYIKSVGGSEKAKQQFPGKQIGFKSGEWFVGFGDDARPLKNGTKLVFNLPNMMAAYQKWVDSSSGKRYPFYTPMTFPALGDEPIERESLGDNDAEEWEKDKTGKPQDPWKPALIFPVRKDGDDQVHHILLTTISSTIAGFNLFRDTIEEMKLHEGQLPLVEIGSSKTSMTKTETDKKGKQKKVKYTWDVPTFAVVDWVDAIDADNPAEGGVPVSDADASDADLGTVTAKARVSAKANGKGKAAKALPAPAKGKAASSKSRRPVEPVEDDEDGEAF